MSNLLDDHAQTRLALAALFAALVQTLRERDEYLAERFDEHIERLYRTMEDYESDPIKTLETLRWTHELLRDTR